MLSNTLKNCNILISQTFHLIKTIWQDLDWYQLHYSLLILCQLNQESVVQLFCLGSASGQQAYDHPSYLMYPFKKYIIEHLQK